MGQSLSQLMSGCQSICQSISRKYKDSSIDGVKVSFKIIRPISESVKHELLIYEHQKSCPLCEHSPHFFLSLVLYSPATFLLSLHILSLLLPFSSFSSISLFPILSLSLFLPSPLSLFPFYSICFPSILSSFSLSLTPSLSLSLTLSFLAFPRLNSHSFPPLPPLARFSDGWRSGRAAGHSV